MLRITSRLMKSSLWAADVAAVTHQLYALDLPSPDEPGAVIFEEVTDDPALHVTVVREHESIGVRPWSGPSKATDGFRYTRTFLNVPIEAIIMSIRQQLGTMSGSTSAQ